jgi:ParB-like chromosome segregation protein Spo0J
VSASPVVKPRTLPLSELHAAPWNANRVPKRTLQKIKRSIKQFGFVENLVARQVAEGYEVLSGNHRLELLRELGVQEVQVVVVELDDARARLLAQTLNRTRGRDNPEAYQALIDDLLSSLGAEMITEFLPETARSLAEHAEPAPSEPPPPSVYGVVVQCRDEQDQVELLSQLMEEGRDCRAML